MKTKFSLLIYSKSIILIIRYNGFTLLTLPGRDFSAVHNAYPPLLSITLS